MSLVAGAGLAPRDRPLAVDTALEALNIREAN